MTKRGKCINWNNIKKKQLLCNWNNKFSFLKNFFNLQ